MFHSYNLNTFAQVYKSYQMKKIIFIAVTFLSFATLTSCSKDGDSPSLQGKWEYFKEGTATSSQEVLENYVHQTGCTKDYSMITATSIMDHTFSGVACTEEISTIPYTRNGNIITTTSGGTTYTFEIKTLDDTTLKVYASNPSSPTVSEVTVFKRVN